MRNRIAALIAGVCLLAGAGGAYIYNTHDHAPAPHARTVAEPAPLDPAARDLAERKATTSWKGQKRHAAATAARKAAAQQQTQGSGGPGPDTPRELACVGHEDEIQCSGVEQRDVGDHHTPTFADRCPNGAATNAACGHEVYGDGPTSGEKQMQWACEQGYADPKDC